MKTIIVIVAGFVYTYKASILNVETENWEKSQQQCFNFSHYYKLTNDIIAFRFF